MSHEAWFFPLPGLGESSLVGEPVNGTEFDLPAATYFTPGVARREKGKLRKPRKQNLVSIKE